jgi:hypothetical protein
MVYEIYQVSFPEDSHHLSNLYFWLKDSIDGKNPKVHDFSVMWKEAGSNLNSFLKKFNLELRADEIRHKKFVFCMISRFPRN